MTQNQLITKPYRFLLLALLGGLFSLNLNAQRHWGTSGNSNPRGNNSSPRINQEQHQQHSSNNQSNNGWNHSNSNNNQPRPPRIDRPVRNNQANNGWNHDRGNNNSQPRQINRQPRSYSNTSNRPGNNAYNNNRYHNNDRNNPRVSRYDSYRRGWGDRRPVYSRYNPGWRYSYLPRRNSIVTSFSFGYQTISYGGYGYRYCDGVYYRPYNNVFRVVAPPFGIYINTLPFGYNRIYVNDNPYYYYNGTYYDDYQDSYRVVQPPVGAVVESIPEGYETVVIDGETYYKIDDVQYKPIVQENGEIWYEVIKVG